MKLDELRTLVKAEGLNVKTNVGGVSRRTKEEFIADIIQGRFDKMSTKTLDEIRALVKAASLDVKTNVGGVTCRTKVDVITDILQACPDILQVTCKMAAEKTRLLDATDDLDAMKLHELHTLVEAEGLDVKRNIGGWRSRTKEDFIADIRQRRFDMESDKALEELQASDNSEGLNVDTNIGGCTKEHLTKDVLQARPNRGSTRVVKRVVTNILTLGLLAFIAFECIQA
jgi:hypothetical protein